MATFLPILRLERVQAAQEGKPEDRRPRHFPNRRRSLVSTDLCDQGI
jgi:hypothetical protein